MHFIVLLQFSFFRLSSLYPDPLYVSFLFAVLYSGRDTLVSGLWSLVSSGQMTSYMNMETINIPAEPSCID